MVDETTADTLNTSRLQELRQKGSSRTPEENAEYDRLVAEENAANNNQTGGDTADMSTQGQGVQPGQPTAGNPPATGDQATQQSNDTQAPAQPANGNVQAPQANDNASGGEPGNAPSGETDESTS